MKIALLTGGGDKPYAQGLVTALAGMGLAIDFVAGDDLAAPEIVTLPGVHFLNLRGDQDPSATYSKKAARVLAYYGRLAAYAATTDCKVFHLLWANRFIVLERVFLLLYYKLLGKKLAFTAHNVNERERDGDDGLLNRLTLRSLYGLVDHVFVHTSKMKTQLITEFKVEEARVSVIPFGINNTLPNSELTRSKARQRLGLDVDARVILFFGNIAPYKGLEHAVMALDRLVRRDRRFHLVIAGGVKGCPEYWKMIRGLIAERNLEEQVTLNVEYIADADVETYFKAADVLALPYKFIYQSGVLFLAYSFGLPVIAADVGSLREDIIQGKTGMVFPPGDPDAMAEAIWQFFAGDHFLYVDANRREIAAAANRKYSWKEAANITHAVYVSLVS